MANYTVRAGEYFSDFTLNSCGDISAWSDCLNENNCSDWTPNIYSGQVLSIPSNTTTNIANISQLAIYPANNFSLSNIDEQLSDLFALLLTATPTDPPTLISKLVDTNTYFEVYPLSTISDFIMNSTGDIENWDLILTENGFSDWTPDLYGGQMLAIPTTVNMNLNNFRGLNSYPANNYVTPDIYNQINVIFDLMNNPISDFILYNPDGQWNDENHYWRDGAYWLD